MLCRHSHPRHEFLLGQLNRCHVGHVLVVDDEIDRTISQRQLFSIGSGAGDVPSARFGSCDLEIEKWLRDIE